MLSIGKIALGQHRYYEQQVARGGDDYYSGRGEAPGEWVGSGAQALGLSGRVSARQFGALIAGRDPRKPSVRLRASARDPKVAALDLTFSAPKSVSVLFAVAPEQASGELVACHEEAVHAALGYLEEEAVMIRRGEGGEHVEPAGGLIAAAYRHRMSRALDPQLHTHVVAANLARGSDGRYTALHGAPLYRAAKTAGILYQSHLRALITERLGWEWGEVRNGAAELSGVQRPVIAHFSKRRHEMLAEAERGGIGLDTKAGAESAALATRERKQYGVETHTWREEVRARAGELGLGKDELTELFDDGRERVEIRTRDAVDEQTIGDQMASPAGLTARSNTFDERQLLQEFAAAAVQGALVYEVRGQAVRFAGREDVLATTHGEMTTAELVDCERRLIAAAVGRAGEGAGVVRSTHVERAIAAADRPLTAEQAMAVRATVSSGHGVTVIQALAGTGKTYTAGVLRHVYESAGFQVLGVAPTGRAARELTEEAGVPARTLDRLLIDIEQLGDGLPQGCVLILDEAGMAATRSSSRVLQAVEHAGAKMIAIGDPGQLASVQAGGWLGAVGRELGVLRLTEVMRQRDAVERRALGALHDRAPRYYLDWAEQAGRIRTFSDPAGACEQALSEWARAAATVGPAQVVMIARDNDTREQLNRGARDLQRSLGALGKERSYGPVAVAVGDRVICRRNDRLIDVDNGMRGTVRHLEADRVVIDTDSGLVRELPAGYVAEHLEHAYSLTGHGMQGGTVERALVVASPRDLTAGWSYTALSRARGQTRLLIYDHRPAAERSEFAPADQTPTAAQDDLLARVQRHMVERDDEDLAIDQLPGSGRAHDPELATSRELAAEPAQERAAALAEPTPPPALTPARLLELRERIEQLQGQLEVLPTSQLRRIENLDARALTLSSQREQLAERLAALPQPRRRFGREQDLHAGECSYLTSILRASERDLDAVLTQRSRLERELGDPVEIRAERDGIKHAITQLAHEQTQVRNELAERELRAPAAWVQDTFGERPDGSRPCEIWEKGVRQAARYRLDHDITDLGSALGPRPEHREEQRDWERTRKALARDQRRLGRDVGTELEVDIGIGL
ncbi:MAG: MobF family relaxase [Solirubrobacteraceae bacterium]|jgi:conjugative relaxase-like TrwC/TraI family protein